MPHLFVLWLALFAAQATTPAAQPPGEPPATQPTQPPAPSATTPDAMGMPSFPPHPTTPAVPPSRNPDASGIYNVAGGVIPPRVLSQPPPKYSEIARQQKIMGIVTLSLIVDAQGNPANVHILKSIGDIVAPAQREAALTLDQAALDAVEQYKFKPGTKDGKPVPVYLSVQVNFELY